MQSSQERQGNLARFLAKLDVLRQATGQGVFAFDLRELEEYLVAYAQSGHPAVSHSAVYRSSYAPAYRVLLAHRLIDLDLPFTPCL